MKKYWELAELENEFFYSAILNFFSKKYISLYYVRICIESSLLGYCILGYLSSNNRFINVELWTKAFFYNCEIVSKPNKLLARFICQLFYVRCISSIIQPWIIKSRIIRPITEQYYPSKIQIELILHCNWVKLLT